VSFASSGPIRAVAKFFFEGDRKFFVKGVTYGPFKPDTDGHYLGPRDQVERDLAQMRQAGLNVVRIYHVPPPWFLDRCAAAGMRVLITLPWAKHVEFLSRKARREIVAMVFVCFNNLAHLALLASLLTTAGPGHLLTAFAVLMTCGELVKIRFLRTTGFTVRNTPASTVRNTPASTVIGLTAAYAVLYTLAALVWVWR
jgi:hypothetical protein